MEWIIKNQNFYWYMAFFLSEAVEASLSYFFENWMMKVKYPKLRIIQIPSNTILQAYFYLSDPNYFWRFNMRYPVTPCAPLTHRFSDLPSALQWKITLLATVEDCKRVADHVHWETIVVAVRPMLTLPPASKAVSRLSASWYTCRRT